MNPRERAVQRDGWSVAVLAACGMALLAGGFMSPAVFTIAQSVDVPAAFAGVAGVLSAAALLIGGTKDVRPTRLAIAWIAFIGWALIAALLSQRALTAFVGEPASMLGWFTVVALAAIAAFCASHAGRVRQLLQAAAPWVLIIEAAFVGVAFVRYAGSGFPADLIGRGTLPNSSGLGALAVIVLPWALSSRSVAVRGGLPWGARAGVAVLTVVLLVATESRVAAAFAVVWLLAALLARTKMSSKSRGIVVACAAAAVLIAGGFYVAIQLQDPTGGQLGLRPQFARLTVRAVAAAPLVGYGPDGFVAGGARASTPDSVGVTGPLIFARGSVDPHNVLLWVAVSTGLAGLTLFLWAITETGIALWRRARSDAPEGTDVGAWSLAGGGVVFLMTPASLALLPVFAAVAGATVGCAGEAEDPDASQGSISSRRMAIGRFTCAGICAIAALALVANALTRLPFERPSSATTPAMARSAQRVAAAWLADPYLFHLASMHLGWAAQADPGIATERADLAAAERAARLDQTDPFIALELARARRGHRLPQDEVRQAFDEVFRRWPTFPLARVEYGSYLESIGAQAEAREQLELFRSWSAQDAQANKAADALEAALGR